MGESLAIAVAGNQSTLFDVTRALLADGLPLTHVLNVGPEKAHMIADYQDAAPFASERGLQLVRPPTYAMKDDASRALLESMRLDLVISVGWQRLFPAWFLQRLRIGAFGMHGSAEPLPRGRGRSPMVWSILEGRTEFFTNLFRYDAGVDDGDIAGTQRFAIGPRDTIRTLQHKNALAQVALLRTHLPALLDGTAELRPQPADVQATYYPKREPADGVLDWRDSCDRIDKMVRAVTRPYPGAFTHAGGERVNVWAGVPFEADLPGAGAPPGTLIAAFHDGTFVVQCGDAPFYVTEWDAPGDWAPAGGGRFDLEANPSWARLAAMYDSPSDVG